MIPLLYPIARADDGKDDGRQGDTAGDDLEGQGFVHGVRSFPSTTSALQRSGGAGLRIGVFTGSDRGGQRTEMMYSLIAIDKLNDIDPPASLAKGDWHQYAEDTPVSDAYLATLGRMTEKTVSSDPTMIATSRLLCPNQI